MQNPFRNGILNMVDELAKELKIGDFEFAIMRGRLKSALNCATEIQAEYFLNKIHNVIGEILSCKMNEKL